MRSATEGCWESTTPDWVFGAALAGGLVMITSALVWGLLFALAKAQPAAPIAPQRSWWRRPTTLLPLVAGSLSVINLVGNHEAWDPLMLGAFAVSLLPMVGLLLVTRRVAASGPLTTARSAPYGLFWSLPVVAFAGLGLSVWAVLDMVTTMRPC